MSDFINCVGCRAMIHKTATVCPKCGAPQKALASAKQAPTVADTQQGYAAVPWFRRRWLVLLLLVTITPIASILAMTGEIFYSSKGEVKQFPKNIKTGLMIASLVWIMYLVNSDNSPGAFAALALIALAVILAFKK
jgi:hypothetical protein